MPDMARKDQTKVYLAYGISPQDTLGTVRGVVVRRTQGVPPSSAGQEAGARLHCTMEEGKRGCCLTVVRWEQQMVDDCPIQSWGLAGQHEGRNQGREVVPCPCRGDRRSRSRPTRRNTGRCW